MPIDKVETTSIYFFFFNTWGTRHANLTLCESCTTLQNWSDNSCLGRLVGRFRTGCRRNFSTKTSRVHHIYNDLPCQVHVSNTIQTTHNQRDRRPRMKNSELEFSNGSDERFRIESGNSFRSAITIISFHLFWIFRSKR